MTSILSQKIHICILCFFSFWPTLFNQSLDRVYWSKAWESPHKIILKTQKFQCTIHQSIQCYLRTLPRWSQLKYLKYELKRIMIHLPIKGRTPFKQKEKRNYLVKILFDSSPSFVTTPLRLSSVNWNTRAPFIFSL